MDYEVKMADQRRCEIEGELKGYKHACYKEEYNNKVRQQLKCMYIPKLYGVILH